MNPEWKLAGYTITLEKDVDWNDLIVRTQVRIDARDISRRLGRTISILNVDGITLDTITWPT